MNVTLFYRDGNNYKCTWDVEIDYEIINNFVKENVDPPEVDGFKYEDLFDKDFSSDQLFEIEDLGLSMYDIPLIKEYGASDMDHNYVSIIRFGEKDE